MRAIRRGPIDFPQSPGLKLNEVVTGPIGPPVNDYAYLIPALQNYVDIDEPLGSRGVQQQYDYLRRRQVLPDTRNREQSYHGTPSGIRGYTAPVENQMDMTKQQLAAMYRDIMMEAERGNEKAKEFIREAQNYLFETR